MPSTNPFAKSNFDPNTLSPLPAVIFDDTGYLSNGGLSNPAGLGYTQAVIDPNLEGQFASVGLGNVVYDIDLQFADATYFYAINSAVTTSGGTTYYVDHGIEGTSGSDVVVDASGANIVNTGAGDDLILVGYFDSFVDAGRGNDVVVTGAGNDVVKLGGGDDFVWLGMGNDSLRAGSGDDTVLGKEGDDVLNAGRGADRIDAGAGNDTVSGGRDADVFVFSAGNERDFIRDFAIGQDQIEVDAATGVTSFNDLLAAASQQGRNTVIDFGNGDELVLRRVDLGDLSASDFDFV